MIILGHMVPPLFFLPESFQNMGSMQGQRLQKEEPIALERLVAVDWWAGGIFFLGSLEAPRTGLVGVSVFFLK